MKVDLHTHSNQSDGTYSPESLIELAHNDNVDCIALCDHDATEGIDRFKLAALKVGIIAFGGIELSASWSLGTCHILGLNVDQYNSGPQSVLKSIRDARDKRNRRIISRLNEPGITIDIEQVEENSNGNITGRPHIAHVLLQMNVVQSM